MPLTFDIRGSFAAAVAAAIDEFGDESPFYTAQL